MQYHIRVKGHLDLTWQPWFAPLELKHEELGITALSGLLPDQAALFGVLLKLQRLGVTLLSLESDAAPFETQQPYATWERGHAHDDQRTDQ